jgi:probable HAF family extracellular repeat protein
MRWARCLPPPPQQVQTGIPTDLGTLPGYPYGEALGINISGQIVGSSTTGAGNGHACLWEPVPEPSAILALLCGLGGLAWRRRK